MVKRPSPPTHHPADLTADQITRAIPRLEKRVADLKKLNFFQMQEDAVWPEIQAIKVSIEQTLEEIFGAHSTEYQRYSPAAVFRGGPLVIGGGRRIDHRPYYDKSRVASIALLETAVQSLIERKADLGHSVQDGGYSRVEETEPEFSSKVFVVHGRDGQHRETVARFLEQLGLEAVILHEQPNKGRALITKFQEVAADIGFAIVLMTPDDIGGIRDGCSEQKPRARQNVIFELGFFIGALGPERVAALIGNDVERPSDFEGVVYIPIESEWRLPLCRELRAAGYDVDLNKVL
jgi:predicted nucleotide-binding protein